MSLNSNFPANAAHRRHVLILAAAFGVVLILLGFHPRHRDDWILENALVVLALLILWAIYWHLPFSRLSWTLVFIFLCLHEVGAHYTYSEVPYQSWWSALTGGSPPAEASGAATRNHFDRMVHFSYGLLLAYPIREIFFHMAGARGFWSYFLPLDLTMSTSALYELIEWGCAELFGGDLGVAFLGSQGDPWDAQKDMALASLGGLIAMLTAALVNWRYQRDFAREWAASFRPQKEIECS